MGELRVSSDLKARQRNMEGGCTVHTGQGHGLKIPPGPPVFLCPASGVSCPPFCFLKQETLSSYAVSHLRAASSPTLLKPLDKCW